MQFAFSPIFTKIDSLRIVIVFHVLLMNGFIAETTVESNKQFSGTLQPSIHFDCIEHGVSSRVSPSVYRNTSII